MRMRMSACLLEPCVAEWSIRFPDITRFVEMWWGREGTEPIDSLMEGDDKHAHLNQ